MNKPVITKSLLELLKPAFQNPLEEYFIAPVTPETIALDIFMCNGVQKDYDKTEYIWFITYEIVTFIMSEFGNILYAQLLTEVE